MFTFIKDMDLAPPGVYMLNNLYKTKLEKYTVFWR